MADTSSRESLRAEHSVESIRARLAMATRHSYLRDFVYGGIDGAVTTFAVVSGVAGAGLSPGIVVILGLANLVGDGFSMAASNFLGSRADLQLLEQARAAEHLHIEIYPEGEREEIRQIFAAKGFSGDDLERAVEIITDDHSRWVDTMLTEELGLSLTKRSPMKAALATIVAFVVIGFIPLLAFVVAAFSTDLVARPYAVSTVLTACAFFTVGAIKSTFVEQKWYWAGMETLTVGGLAPALAFAVGAAMGAFM